ncbi:MAG: UDP-N-acetylmuramate--L-alanine ligase [Gemmatimonadota bacterium]
MPLFTPDDSRPLHFMGVAGAGMSGLALLARKRGVAVTGCDRDLGTAGGLEAVDDVRRSGGEVFAGHDPEHVKGARALVVSSAIPKDHPEVERARALGIPVVRRAEALAEAVSPGLLVAVAGTHGKTTTTAMTTEALAAAGRNPTGIVGGRIASWGGNVLIGGTDLYVVEADEYDKSFLALKPEVAVINNVEADHLECYGSIGSLEEAFARFAAPARRLIVGGDDKGAVRVAQVAGRPTYRVGLGAEAEVRITRLEQSERGSRATVVFPDIGSLDIRLAVPGVHNVRNAAAALAVGAEVGADLEKVVRALSVFRGVGRRFDVVGEAGGVAVVDDYAHHPTEIAATLEAARQAYPGRRLVAVFQPHLFSRTQAMAAEMGAALTGADVVVVADIYPSRESPIPGVTGRLVADAAEGTGVAVHWVPSRSELVARVRALSRPGDVVLTMGAGDVTSAGPELIARLREGDGVLA